jgi:hypothetical protein
MPDSTLRFSRIGAKKGVPEFGVMDRVFGGALRPAFGLEAARERRQASDRLFALGARGRQVWQRQVWPMLANCPQLLLK